MRREFVANVSHELKTPITSIQGYSETLLSSDDIDKETREKFLEVINKEAERMSRLVSDLLKLSKMDFQSNAMNRASFNAVKLAANCIDKIFIEADKKNQELVLFNEGDDEIYAYANEVDVEQVLLNIISNAIKYTPEGGKIAVKVEQIGDYAEILVKDNGIGIPKEDLPRIFERFYRVDKARSRDVGGTGLGLAIVKHIVKNLGGTINVKSEFGKGSEFTVNIPKKNFLK